MELRVKFNVEEPTLFELSFLSLDLLRLNVVSTYIDEAQEEPTKSRLSKLKDFDRAYYNRASLGKFYEKHKKNIEVKEFKEGSIELVIAGLGIAAAVIVPTVLYYLNKRDDRGNQVVNFTVYSQDPEINRFLD